MEEWKVLKSFDKTGRKFVEGDVVYISNKGRIKLNDTILEIGNGLYVNNDGQICIVGLSYGEHTTLYRWIYYNFIGDYIKGGGYNIHHIDGNHLNNAADNLIQLSAYRHGKIHAEQYDKLKDTIDNTNKQIKYYIENKEKYIKNGTDFFKNRIVEYYNSKDYKQKIEKEQQEKQEAKIKKQQEKQQEKELKAAERLKQKQIEEQQKIDAGTHFRCKNGRLMSYQQLKNMHSGPRDWSYMTDEWRENMSKKMSDYYKEHGSVCSTPEKEIERRRKIREAHKKLKQ